MSSIYFAVTTDSNEADKYFPPTSLSCKMFKKISSLDCSYRNLIVVPYIDRNTTVVSFLRNDIQTITSTAFSGQSQLTSIDFSLNRLKNLTGSPFLELISLRFLNVSFNQLSFFSSTAFKGLHDLQTLDIVNNKLRAISDDIFEDLINLRLLLLGPT